MPRSGAEHAMVRPEIFDQFCSDNFELRTLAEHKRQCQVLNETELEQLKEWCIIYGVNRETPLLQESYVQFNMAVHDPMHTLHEGALPFVMKNVLKVLIKLKRQFTLNWINLQVQNFELFYLDSGKSVFD